MLIDGVNIHQAIRAQHARMRTISNRLRQGEWRGATGEPITDVVNLGIGGSDLGPKMAYEALRDYAHPDLHVHFVSNVDAHDLLDVLARLNPARTLFIIASKSFTTPETMLNARTARTWLQSALGNEAVLSAHLLGITANPAAAIEFGIHEDHLLTMWDWVGGRFSLWSTIGLPVAIGLGMQRFEELLAGAYAMDRHFRTTPHAHNIPVILALLGIWYINFFSARNHAILPYAQRLKYLPAYLQQADMESNGKSVDRFGHTVDYVTGPVLFGELGINGQHAFYQSLHQGTHLIPVDLIAEISTFDEQPSHQHALLSNVLAQGEALMRGLTQEEVQAQLLAQGMAPDLIGKLASYRSFAGNKPSNTILMNKLDPRTLGSLLMD